MRHLKEAIKYAVYRTPVVDRLMAPSYPYGLNPGQLTAMVDLIESTRGSGAAVAEIGVAKGDTSLFLLEHLRTRDDDRTLLLFDTFSGFTPESIHHETANRGKSSSSYDKFRYGDEARFQRNLRNAGYDRFRTIRGRRLQIRLEFDRADRGRDPRYRSIPADDFGTEQYLSSPCSRRGRYCGRLSREYSLGRVPPGIRRIYRCP